jgi:hypothetical protein
VLYVIFVGFPVALIAAVLAYALWYMHREDMAQHAVPRNPVLRQSAAGARHAIPPHPRYAGIPGMEGPSVPVQHAAPPAEITDCPAVRSAASWDSGSSGIHAAIRP